MNKSLFATDQLAKVVERIEAGTTTSVLGIPGAGISLFLKQLNAQSLGHMVYLDVFSMPAQRTHDFYAALLTRLGGDPTLKTTEEIVTACQEWLKYLITLTSRVVITVAGFDQLQPEFSAEFFHYLHTLRAVNPAKVVFVFGICRRLDTILPSDLTDTDLNLFTSVYYLKPYSHDDMRQLLTLYGSATDLESEAIDQLITISGGHFQFLQLLLASEKRTQPTSDPFIQLAFKNIYHHLSAPEKTIVRKIADSGASSKTDDYLMNTEIVRKTADGYKLFSPLFESCVRAFSMPRLPVKEKRLMKILRQNEGRIVSKRELYDAIWRDQELGSEWALNALIYRLRKHPAFITQNYVIENHKKLGYMLSKKF